MILAQFAVVLKFIIISITLIKL